MAYPIAVPATLEVLSYGEQIPLTVDASGMLAVGDVVSSPVVTIKDVASGAQPTSAIGGPSLVGTQGMTVTLYTSYLAAKHTYVVNYTFLVTDNVGGTKTVSVSRNIYVTR